MISRKTYLNMLNHLKKRKSDITLQLSLPLMISVRNESETNTEVSGSPLGQDEALTSSLQSQTTALSSPPQTLSTSPQFQDSPLSDISPELPDTSPSDADSEVIQNPYVEQ